MKYEIILPGKEPRIVENINFEILLKRVENLGGSIRKIVDSKEEEKKRIIEAQRQAILKKKTETVTYSWAEVMRFFDDIHKKYFPNVVVNNVEPLPKRTSWLLGRACYSTKTVKLSKNLLDKNSKNLKQVIFHELCHLEFPGEGHTGRRFRYKEMNNPFRIKKTKRLTCIS